MIYFKDNPSEKYIQMLNDYESNHKNKTVNSKIKTVILCKFSK